MSSTRASITAAILILALASPASAASSLHLEVREPKKARLIAADIWIRTLAGKLVRKLYAASGRVRYQNAPVGTFNVEVRTRSGNLVGRSRVVIRANALARAVIAVKPAPPKTMTATPIKAGAVRQPVAHRGRAPRRATTTPRQTRGRGRAPARTSRNRRGARPMKVGTVTTMKAGAMTLPARDWGKGKVRVYRGDVLDAKGRRLAGKIQVYSYSGKKIIGHVNVPTGYFSLYDLVNGTYQLRFATLDNKRRVNTNVGIVKGKLGKAVLRVP